MCGGGEGGRIGGRGGGMAVCGGGGGGGGEGGGVDVCVGGYKSTTIIIRMYLTRVVSALSYVTIRLNQQDTRIQPL